MSARFAFVVGTGRCGSSLLHEVLARHPDVGFISNLDDRLRTTRFSRWNNQVLRRLPASAATKGRPRFAPSEGYRVLGSGVTPMLCDPVRDLTALDATPWLRDRTRHFFTGAAALQGRSLFLHKFTGWPRTGFVAAALPEAKFVHVVRDGRAVASSFLQMGWWRGHLGPEGWGLGPLPDRLGAEWDASGRSFVVLAGLAWRILIDAFADARTKIDGSRWLDVRYEDLVADPVTTLRAVERFLALPPGADPSARAAGYRFHPGRASAYRRELGAENVAALERSLAEHLAAFGYGTGPG